MFNVRLKRFYNGNVQIQIYSQPIRQNFDDRRFDHLTGEILGKGHWEYNPFEEKNELMTYMGDPHVNLIRSVRRTKNKVYDIARSNPWEWFFTLTFNPEKVDSFNYEECTKKLSTWLNNMRKKCPDMIYLVVPEQHVSGRWHFHGLFANCDSLNFVDSGHTDKKGKVIYNVGSYKLGFSTATKIVDLQKSCSYVCKYITEELCSLANGKKRYWVSRNVCMPEIEDLYVGLSARQIYDCIDGSFHVSTVNGEYSDVTYIDCMSDGLDMNLLYANRLNFEVAYDD